MKLVVIASKAVDLPNDIEYPAVILIKNDWDDYGFQTNFNAIVALAEYEHISLGAVKIAYWGYKSKDGPMRDLLEISSSGLPENYYSLGQKLDYYEALNELPEDIRSQFARVMRDIPLLQINGDRLADEDAFDTSLTRSSYAREAFDRAREMFGQKQRSVDAFQFRTTLNGAESPHRIDFDFSPNNGLPHRINALVGVNGVGKTQLMARLAILLSQFEEKKDQELRIEANGSLKDLGSLTPVPSFYSVIAVSFSAFDDFELPSAEETKNFRYVYCGLRGQDGLIQDDAGLAERIPSLLDQMGDDRRNVAVDLIGRAIGRDISVDQVGDADWYNTLSAGQRIVANIVCELMVHLRSRSLVLLDEPETHLHPQLMSRLLSILNDLLEGSDSSAVIATHSPIIIQQIMARRVHILRRVDATPVVSNPIIETFGENLTDIVRKVFSSIESDRGYQEHLDRLFEQHNGDIETIEALFEGRLGFNALMHLRSMEA